MDPLTLALMAGILVLLGIAWFVNTKPSRYGRGSIVLGPTIICTLPKEKQRALAQKRNLVFQRIEEEARMRGEIEPEVFGTRMAAINAIPLARRRTVDMEGPAWIS